MIKLYAITPPTAIVVTEMKKKNQTKQKQPNDKTFTIAVSALNINIVESFFRNVIFRKSTAYRWLWAHLHIHYFVFIWFIFCGVVRICQRIEKGPTLYIYLMHAIVWFYFQNFRSLSRIKNKAQLNRAPFEQATTTIALATRRFSERKRQMGRRARAVEWRGEKTIIWEFPMATK